MNINLNLLDKLPEDKICALIRCDPSLIYDRVPRTELYCHTAVQQDGRWLQCVPKAVQTNEICLSAVRNFGKALKFVAPQLVTEEICFEAVCNDPQAISFVPKEFFSIPLLSEVLRRDGLLIDRIHSPLRSSEDLITIAVSQNGLALKYVDRKFLRKSLCLLAVQQNGLALEFVPTRTKGIALCKEALLQNPLALQFVPDNLITFELCKNAILHDPMALQFVPSEMQTTELFELAVSNNPLALEHVPDEKKNEELCKHALLANYLSFQFIPTHLLLLSDYVYILQSLNAELSITETTNTDNDHFHLIQHRIVDWPNEVKEDLSIISLNRSIGLQKILSKRYDPKDKVFIVDEQYLYSNETKTSSFSTFHDFYSYLGKDLTGSDLYSYDFEDVDLRSYNIANAGISSSVLIQQGLYDSSFYDTVVTQNIHLYDTNESQSSELVPTESSIHLPNVQTTSPDTKLKLYYISDLHLDHKLKKAFPSHASKGEIERFIDNLVQKMWESADERKYGDYLLIAGDDAFSFELAEMFYRSLAKKCIKNHNFCIKRTLNAW